MMADILSRCFTLDVGDRPILTFEASSLREARELCYEQWLREDIARLSSNEIPIWDGSAALRSRYATEAEAELYRAAAQNAEHSPGDLVLAYHVELDGAEAE